MSALAHVFENAGLATVGISSIRAQAEAGRAPRMLYCEFPLGRPLGKPGDAHFQTEVLNAAFALLGRVDVPVLVDYTETIADAADEPLTCQIPLRDDPSVHPAIAEVLGLRVAYERQRAAAGRTLCTRAGGPDHVREHVEAFLRISQGTPFAEAGLAVGDMGPAALDVRAYFEEAALALSDHVPEARQAESWFYRNTQTGLVLRQARAAIVAADGPRAAWFPLVPVGQPVTVE